MEYWPRKRAKRSYARVKSWPKLDETRLLGFIGYKAGMTHILAKDNTSTSMTKNQIICVPVTVVECPPIKPLSIRFYKIISNNKKLVSEIFSQKTNKELLRKLKPSKKQNKQPEQFDDIKLVIYTQPKLTGIKKKPEVLELGLSGAKEKKLELARQLLEKNEIKLQDVFKEKQLADVLSVTKGKGFQGVVKRYHISLLQHKAEKKKRGIASQGPWTPKKVSYRVPRAGKMGYHQRTELNKQILKIGTDPKEVNPVSGFLHFGLIKNPYLILKGSVPGPAKRPVVMTYPRRPFSKAQNLEITKISQSSKQ